MLAAPTENQDPILWDSNLLHTVHGCKEVGRGCRMKLKAISRHRKLSDLGRIYFLFCLSGWGN